MAKGTGNTRSANSHNASSSRTFTRVTESTNASTSSSASTSTKYNAEYISAKTKEINSFKLPKANSYEDITIKGVEYRINHVPSYDGRHIIDVVRKSDGYSFGRDVFTNSGSYGMAITRTKSQVQKAIREELLRLLNK